MPGSRRHPGRPAVCRISESAAPTAWPDPPDTLQGQFFIESSLIHRQAQENYMQDAIKSVFLKVFCCQGLVVPTRDIRGHLRAIQVLQEEQQQQVQRDSCGTGRPPVTWKPAPSLWVTIFKLRDAKTGVYLHCEQRAYHMPADLAPLSQECPPGTCLLGQFVVDHAHAPGKDPVPRILVFDILQLGDSPVDWAPAAQRYETLRQHAGALLAAPGGSFESSSPALATVQWAGDEAAARAFCSRAGETLPHDVDFLFELTDGDPLAVRGLWHGAGRSSLDGPRAS